MSSIFISYRRDDSAAHAGRLHDRLAAAFGTDHVFIDIDAIEPGQDFDAVIRRTLDRARVVLVVIGPRWLGLAGASGGRRLDDPNDLVRLEVAAALQRGIALIPVLVGGARMPAGGELPDDLRGLAQRNAVELSDTRFHRDTDALIEVLRRHAGAPGADSFRALRRPRRWLALGALALLLGGGVAAWWLRSGGTAPAVEAGPQRGADALPDAQRSGGPPLRAPGEAASGVASDTTPWRWRARHILIALPPHPGEAESRKARERAERLADSARRAPAEFAALAQRFSDDASSAVRGGDLGYFRAGTMTRTFEDAVLGMRKGEIAGPVQSPYGFHVIQLTSVQRSSRVVMNGQELFVDVD